MTTPLEYLYSLEFFGIKFGLENIRAILHALDHPENAFRSVHIAGTNGKGSVTAMVDAALRAAGYRSARYTSPHLVDLTERFVVDGEPITEEQLIRVIARVRDAIADLQRAAVLDVHPTFFEVTTAAAFEIFRQAAVQVAVCEVGLGGRLDATNVLSPMVTAITSIAFDHQQYLGTSLAEIAAEKAGIVKPGVPVVVGSLDAEAAKVVRAIAHDRQASLIVAHEDVSVERVQGGSIDGIEQTIRLRTPRADYAIVRLNLQGRHQIDNAVVAVRLLECLDEAGLTVPQSAITTGLASVKWPGRLELIHLGDGRSLLLDAAHNPAGGLALAEFLAERRLREPLVFAAMRDKDAHGILTTLLLGPRHAAAEAGPLVSSLVVTRASNPRSADPRSLADVARAIAPDVPVHITDTVSGALDRAWKLSPQIIVAGSIFLLGDVVKELRNT